MDQTIKKRNSWQRAGRIILKTLLSVLAFLVIVILLIQTPPVQNFVRKKTVAWLEKKLDTRIEVERIFIGLPKNIILEGLYVEDRKGDTLLYGGKLKANINLLRLIFNNETDFRNIELKDMTAKIRRDLPDTVFNFQFIVDAFAPPADTSSVNDTSAASPISIRSVTLDNIHLVYKDIVTGSDMEGRLEHLDTRIDRFDPQQLHFEVPEINVRGLQAKIYQVKPVASPEPEAKDKMEASAPVSMVLDFENINLESIKLDYRNDVSAMYANIDLGSLNLKPGNMDLANRTIDLDKLQLEETTASIRLGRKAEARVVEQEVEKELESRAETGWKVTAASVLMKKNNIRFDNDNSPRAAYGMDYAHLHATDLNLGVEDLVLSIDSIAGRINNGSFREQSGFELNELRATCLYTENGASIQDLYLKTPGTELRRAAAIRYASLESLKNHPGNMEVDLDLEQSRILVKDVLTFAPELRGKPAFANPSATWYVDSRITGRVSDLRIANLELSGLRDTRISMSGELGGMPDPDAIAANLDIHHARTSKRDLELFLPPNSLPDNLNLPEIINLKGSVRGNPASLKTDLVVNSSLGNAGIEGSFSRLADPARMKYDAAVNVNSLNLASLLRNPELPSGMSATVSAKGTGVDPKTANASFEGVVHSATLHDYTYRNLNVSGSVTNQQAEVRASMVDPNIHFDLAAAADLSSSYPALRVQGMIDSIKFRNLHLSDDEMIFRGQVDANFANTNPDALVGRLDLIQPLFVLNDQRLQLDTVWLNAGVTDTARYLRLNSAVAFAELKGNYRLTRLGQIFLQSIDPYFSISPGTTDGITDTYDFNLNAYILDNPALKAFMPGIGRVDSVTLEAHFSNAGWNATVDAPAIDLGPNQVRGLHLVAGTGANAIDLDATISRLSSGDLLELDNTTLRASIANNEADFRLNIKDPASVDKYNIHGLLKQPSRGTYAINIRPDSLLLNYDTWMIAGGNTITISQQGINAQDLVLSRNGQQLTIDSRTAGANAPMDVTFSEFGLETLAGFVQTDKTLAQGRMNGKITFTELGSAPVFVGDLMINDLVLKTDTVGDLRIVANNKAAQTYFADITLTGRGNDVRMTGNYYVRPANNSNFDFDLDMRTLQLSSAQAFTGGAIRESSGTVSGRFDVSGNLQRPVVIGDLSFNKARFNFSMLNTFFNIDGERLRVNREGVYFDNFEIRDSANNPLRIDGVAKTSNFSNYDFDIKLRARNFKMLSSTKKDNDIFYGHLYFNTDLTLTGTEALPRVEGRLVVNEDTRMTVVLPQRDPGVVEREGVIEFVDFNAPVNDSLFLAPYDSLNRSRILGADISVNIEVKPEAEFSLIIDEGNGDFLNVKGEALLNAGIDPSGKVTLSGSYELQEGAYELTFNFLRRRFEIEQGSRIVWEGEPTDATVNLRARYTANAAPLDLVKNQIGEVDATVRNTYLQKLPFEVFLSMNGELLKPMISFDIVLPEKNYTVSNDIVTNVQTRLEQLRQEEAEMNKQVFSLLLLNRFVAENPFNSSTSGPTVGTLARQSVSKLLTEQLNRLADDLIAGVDLNFDVISSEDYTTGQRRDRTDLNVGLSKQLLNDRLTISIGSNFELEGPRNSTYNASNIAGNIAVDYQLSRDKRYVLRAYRKNEYEGIIDGYIVETGVGFIITLDYNRFNQIFRKRRPRNRNREQQPATQTEQALPGKEQENK